MFYVSLWIQKLVHNVSFWIQSFISQKLTFLNSFWIQKLIFCVSFWVQKLIHNISFWLIYAYRVRVDLIFKALLYSVVNGKGNACTSNKENFLPLSKCL